MSQLEFVRAARSLCGLMALIILSGCGSSEPVATSPLPQPAGNSADKSGAGADRHTADQTTQPLANDVGTATESAQARTAEPTPTPAVIPPVIPPPVDGQSPGGETTGTGRETAPANPPPEVKGLTRLDPKHEVWIDPKQKRVLMTGEVVRQEGQLEMFACLKNTKEHESVIAVDTKAYIVNAALIALGAKPGGPVQFRPEFKPASGPEVEVTVIYTDKEGKRREVRGQEWIRNIKTNKALDQPWVFGGSGFWEDESTGQRHFMAEDGDFICISNFNSAMLDLPVESSQASADLMFEAFTERIPPVKTPVVLVLTPKTEAKSEGTTAAKKTADEKQE